MTRALLASALAALALLAAGCGGGGESAVGSPADEWADGFCTAISTWTDSVRSVTEQFSSPSSLTSDALSEAANDVRSATETLVDDLRALGAPETESGEAVLASIDELSTTLESEVTTIDRAAEGVSGLAELPSAITSFTTSLSAIVTAFSSTRQAVESVEGELRTALEDSPACAGISG